MKGVFTNTTPVDAYRGAGRPEAIYVIERLMDWSARDLGLDPVELRRRNFIPREKFPYRSVSRRDSTTSATSSGCSTGRSTRRDVAGFAARKAESARAGRLRGLGLCLLHRVDPRRPERDDDHRLRRRRHGRAATSGTQSNGQGHETAFAQILVERSGIPFEKIRFVQGDSDRIAKGGGTGGSRSVTMQGNSINHAADEVIARFRPLAEDELEVASADLVFEDGAFRVAGTDRAVGLMRARRGGAARGQARAPGHHARVRGARAVLSRTARISPRSRSTRRPGGPRW